MKYVNDDPIKTANKLTTDMTTLTNVMYDISYIISLGILISTRVCRNKSDACSTCAHNRRCK